MDKYIGQIFGRLIIESVYLKQCKNKRRTHAICICKCGQKCDIRLNSLKSGTTKSCGCLQKEMVSKVTIERNITHGKSNHKLYDVWSSLIRRCTNIKDISYYNYGGRGISVCDEWGDFKKFYDWAIRNNWEEGLQIDRIDNNGDYCPENCQFITPKQNNRNRRDNFIFSCWGETKTLVEWSEDYRCKVKCVTLRSRIVRGWSIEKSLIQPINHNNKTFDN